MQCWRNIALLLGCITCTHTHTFNGALSRTTRVIQYQKGKTILDFTEARDSEWQWHQLGHMQVCTSLQTDASTSPLSFLQAGCPSCRPTNSVKALKVGLHHMHSLYVCLSVSLLYTTMSCAKSLKRLKRSRCHLECWHGWAKGTVFLVGPGAPWGKGNFGCVSCEADFCQSFLTTCFFYNATWNWMTCNVLMYHKQIVNLNMMARKTEATVFDFHIC